jgi:tagatose 1,6-diphosphate aldolase
MISVGAYRHLSQCADSNGVFVVLALDHRDNLVAELQKHHTQPLTYQEFVDFKKAVLKHLLPFSSAALIDPDYGFPALLQSGISPNMGLLAPLEVTNYTPHPSQRETNFIEGWGVDKLKKAGFSGVKLLLYFHPAANNAQSQTEIVDRVVEQCQKQQIPLFLEPICYSLDPQRPLNNIERRQAVIESARHFTQRGVDILKLEFPLDTQEEKDESIWQESLHELNAVCTVPWALLSAGVSFDVFLRQTELACAAGSSGVIVGRAIWAEAAHLQGNALDQFLSTVASERMRQIAEACKTSTPWKALYPIPDIGEGWYR